MQRKPTTIVGVGLATLFVVFFLFVPVIGQTKTLWARWGTLYNEMPQTEGGCPSMHKCIGEMEALNIPYTASLSYYLWRFGAYNIQGSIRVWINGNSTQATYEGSTYVFATGSTPCFTGYICLENVTGITVVSSTS